MWSMRNNTNYMQTGVLAALQLTSRRSRKSCSRTSTQEPELDRSRQEGRAARLRHPAGQKDMTRVALLVNLLRVQGIEVGRAEGRGQARRTARSPPGSFVIKRDQPYGRLAKILLEKQDFPDANLRTYDDTGWTMGLMLQADVKAIADKAMLDVAVEPVNARRETGRCIERRSRARRRSSSPITARTRWSRCAIALKELTVQATEQPFKPATTRAIRRGRSSSPRRRPDATSPLPCARRSSRWASPPRA